MRRRRGYGGGGRYRSNGPSALAYVVLLIASVAALGLFVVPTILPSNERVCLRTEPSVPTTISGSAREITATVAAASLECAERILIIDPEVHDVTAASRTALNRQAVLLAGSPSEVDLLAATVALLEPDVVWWPGHPNDFGGRLLPLDSDTELTTIELDPAAEVPEPDPDAPPIEVAWLAPADQPELAEMVRPLATLADQGVGLVDLHGDKFEAPFAAGDDVRASFLGELTPSEEWLLSGLVSGRTLPDGGVTLFPDRHLIAFYGSPGVPSLGVLGSTEGPEVALAELAPILREFEELDVEVMPAFEIIVTVAANDAGSDGNYSTELSVENIKPWVDKAGELGVYVLLDIQPGRTDFLTQAMLYEEFLLEPHVGLALDPEWRLYDDQKHLEQVGTVSATEVNTVIEWMASTIRENDLPQKALIVHQYGPGMVIDRGSVQVTPEVAVVFHADGQGRQWDKLETYGYVTQAQAPEGIFWGWKNFFDKDSPLATAREILALDPEPFVITYQ